MTTLQILNGKVRVPEAVAARFGVTNVQDVYLYVAQALFPELKERMAEVYAPGGAVTTDSVKATKRAFKAERDLTKPIHLASAYGAGAGKMYSQIKLAGLKPDITLDEVQVMRKRYQALFAGIRAWRDALEQEWSDRGGWIYNGSGRPLAVAQAKLHDVVNTFCQSTGVDCLLKFVYYIDTLRRARGVPMRPFHVNQHDATTWAVRTGHEAEAQAVFEDAMTALNQDLAPPVALPGAPKYIPMTGSVAFGHSLWDFKAE